MALKYGSQPLPGNLNISGTEAAPNPSNVFPMPNAEGNFGIPSNLSAPLAGEEEPPTPGPVPEPPGQPETPPYGNPRPRRPRPERPRDEWRPWDRHRHYKPTYGKGTKMLEYLYWKRYGQPSQPINEDPSQPLPVVTQHPEALKQAMVILGLQSEKNPLGLDLDMETAKEIWFGADKVNNLSEVDEAEFRSQMEAGDSNIDRKRIRQFVNYDGSTTYEVLNPDKSVMARFTMGVYKNQRVFVTGNYEAYAAQLKALASQKAAQSKSVAEQFEEIRKTYAE
jgi:hypothetical protein